MSLHTVVSTLLSRIETIPRLGILCSIFSNMLFAFSIILTKAAIVNGNVLGVGLVRVVIQFSVLLPIMAWYRIPVFALKGERVYLLACAGTYIVFLMSLIVAFAYIPAADATAIVAATPIIVTLIGPCFLKESFKKKFVFNAILTIIGVILIDRPSFLDSVFGYEETIENRSDGKRLYGILLAIFAMLANSGISILNKKLEKTSSWTCSMFYPFVTCFGFIIAMSATGNFNLPGCGLSAVHTIVAGVIHTTASIIYIVSFKYEDAGPLSISGNIEIPLVLILEVLFMGTHPPLTTLLGIALVIAGVFLTALPKFEVDRNKLVNRICCCFKSSPKKQVNKLAKQEMFVYAISYSKSNKFE